MNREDIIKLGKQAGFTDGDFASFTDLIVHFGTLVEATARADEREACEALREHEDVQAPVGNSSWGEAYQEGWAEGTAAYRNVIRARG